MAVASPQRSARLDHLRGLAAFMVFAWHFTHAFRVIPATQPSWFPLLEEGHIGVALFMVLSGYLFARITGNETVRFRAFVSARVTRLAPLLLLGLLLAYAPKPRKWLDIPLGLILPRWDHGCWSIAVELQFYCLLPLLLPFVRKQPISGAALILFVAMAARVLTYASGGDLHTLAYYTLVGRIDQFVLGIAAWQVSQRRRISGQVFAAGFGAFIVALHGFDLAGGLDGSGQSAIWIVWPTVEGLGFALLIGWYDGGRWEMPRCFAFVGRVSFSMYILHFVLVGRLAWIALDGLGVHNVYLMMALSVVAFAALLPLAWTSWWILERPLMDRRRGYLAGPSGSRARNEQLVSVIGAEID